MDMEIEDFSHLQKLATTLLGREQIVVVNPEEYTEEELHGNMIYDSSTWDMPDDLRKLVHELQQNEQLQLEDKMLVIYEWISKKYVYDDNLISYIRTDNTDPTHRVHTVPDEYGRKVDEQWKRNRENHNRRVCYELSRYLAKALKELCKEDIHICILWDKTHIHYYVRNYLHGIYCEI